MELTANMIFNIIYTIGLAYVTWLVNDRNHKHDKKHEGIEKDIADLKDAEKKFYKDFVSNEQHNMDINAVFRKIDDMNKTLMDVHRDIGELVGRNKADGK